MTLTKLTIGVAVVALVLTILIAAFTKKRVKNLLISYLQCFTGSLFIFSGVVKAIDPLGTAYKMEQYFAEFETLFQGTWFSFVSPMFPFLSEYSIGFSVGVIIFEILLGLMLLLGTSPKFTSWAFFLLVAFFTVLTGFTYLTGYVPGEVIVAEKGEETKQIQFIEFDQYHEDGWMPQDTMEVTFFDFGNWSEYKETNMKVTDCGCFGDFLKLKPRTSFFKDIFLMIPALLFLFFSSQFHQIGNAGLRAFLTIGAGVGLFFYCQSNYQSDLPHTDFRPFKKGVNVRAQKAYEEEATIVKVIGYKLTNKQTGEKIELSKDDYLAKFKDYPKTDWDFEQVRSKPSIEPTKISEFAVEHRDGYEITEDILNEPGYSFMIVAYELYDESVTSNTHTYRDTVYAIDTLKLQDTFQLIQRIDKITERVINQDQYTWKEAYVKRWSEVVNPVLEAAEKKGFKAYAVTKPYADYAIEDFKKATQSIYPFYKADDILLKTIVRSNPGIVLWKDGQIVNKWHYKKLPSFGEIEAVLAKTNL